MTEVDIIKHVHIHKEADSKNVVPVETDEPVETVEMVHFTISHVKPKPSRKHRLPWSVSKNIDYVNQDKQSDTDKSPSLKRIWHMRPKREPSNSCIKSESFIMKNPSIRPLHKSTSYPITKMRHLQKMCPLTRVRGVNHLYQPPLHPIHLWEIIPKVHLLPKA